MVIFVFRILLLLPLLLLALDRPAFPSSEHNSLGLDTHLPFCEVAKQYHVSPEVLAGVFTFENQINRGVKDTIEDAAFRLLLANTDEAWWDKWAEDTMRMAAAAEEAHLLSNKWPVEVIATGLVVSIGPAQITPRTALRACQTLGSNPICSRGVKVLISQMLNEDTSIEVAAIVLRFEADLDMRLTGKDITADAGAWATIYNVGGEYYRKMYQTDITTPANRLGQWVSRHSNDINLLLHCAV